AVLLGLDAAAHAIGPRGGRPGSPSPWRNGRRSAMGEPTISHRWGLWHDRARPGYLESRTPECTGREGTRKAGDVHFDETVRKHAQDVAEDHRGSSGRRRRAVAGGVAGQVAEDHA